MGIFGSIIRAASSGFPGTDARTENDANAQEKQLQAQNMQRQQQQQDEEFAQHMLDMKALNVQNGAVKRDLTLPDGRTIPGGLLDKADSSRMINHKTADGRTVQFELPSAEEQIGTHAKRLMQQFTEGSPLVEAQGQQAAKQTQRNEQAKEAGTGAGKLQSEQAEMNARGIPLSTEDATRYQLPSSMAGTKVLPETMTGLSGKIIPPTVRAETQLNIADKNNAAKEQRLQEITAYKDFNAVRQQQLTQSIQTQRNAIQAGVNPSLAPIKLRAFDNSIAQHDQLRSQVDQEQARIFDAKEILDPQDTPDGTPFTNPWTGLKQTMGPGVRQVLQNRMGMSQQTVNNLSKQADGVLQKTGVAPPGAAPSSGAQPGAAPTNGTPKPAGTASASPTTKPLSPEAADAADIFNHRMSPSQAMAQIGGRGMQKTARLDRMKAELRKLDPNFNWEDAESSYALVKSPAFQQTIRYMDYAGSTLDNLVKNAQALDNTDVRSINALLNAGKDQVNNVNLKKFQTDKIESADAVAKILQGGGSGSGTSDMKLKQAESIFRDSDSPKAIAAAATEIKGLLGNRRQTLTRGTYMENQAPPPGAASTGTPIVQHSPSTGAYRYSTDGGKTWQAGQPK